MLTLLGTCVNLFDEDGEAVDCVPFSDVTEFAYLLEQAETITPEQFWNQCITPLGVAFEPDAIYMVIGCNLLVVYNQDEDIHYVFG